MHKSNPSLAKTHPHIAEQWHPTKNGNLTPSMVTYGCDKLVWWKCPKGDDHEFEARVYCRAGKNKKGKCPVCLNIQIVYSNSLANTNPHIAAEWHPTKNGTLTPAMVTAGSQKKIWWKCPKGDDHEWRANVSDRTKLNGSRCPVCKGLKIVFSNCLASTHPEIANQWHSEKNENLTPFNVGSGSHKKVWWQCPVEKVHVWRTEVRVRAKQMCGCPICGGLMAVPSNSLATLYPQIAAEWHQSKNKKMTPNDIVPGSSKAVWWKCPKGDDHVWLAKVADRTKPNGTNCPVCARKKVTKTNCLSMTHPGIAAEWHPTKNSALTPDQVVSGSGKIVWWKCPKGDDHEFQSSVNTRTHNKRKGNCPICINQVVVFSNSLKALYPEISKEWHQSRNGNLTPNMVVPGSGKIVWWKCSKGEDHEFRAAIIDRTKGGGCSICSNRVVKLSNSLLKTHPELSKQWHLTKNGNLLPKLIVAGSNKKVWWKCPNGDDHEWQASVVNRARNKSGCPICVNQKIVHSNCLANTHPNLAKEWHVIKNGDLASYDIGAGSHQVVWWQCSKNPDHEWQASPVNRKKGTGCPYCNSGWTIPKIRLFVKSLSSHLNFLSPAELYVIFQQNGLSPQNSKGKSFIEALKTGKFPKVELEKFINDQPSLVDEFISNKITSIEELNETELSPCLSENSISLSEDEYPLIETKDILSTLESKLISNIDKEVIDFFVSSATSKIWAHAFYDEDAAVRQLENNLSDSYAREVKSTFLEQYNGAKNLCIPDGYNFIKNGVLCYPNLMQRFTAYMLVKNKRLGNWSGTGAGKTLSAILASRVIKANLTIICCPNNVIIGWEKNLKSIYPDSNVCAKDINFKPIKDKHNYLVLNYEFFQQANSEKILKNFVETNMIDFIVIDEIHYSKQREVENISKRKKIISAMLSEASERNKNLHVLGMSATPVINNLFEGKTLIELITGIHHDELCTKPSVANCIALYQKLVSHGIRWLPKYNQRVNIQPIEIDCSEFLDEIRNINPHGTMVDLEAILTSAKLPIILKHIKQKTIIYTHYLKNILEPLKVSIEGEGWKTAVYSGDDKSGLVEFLKFDADVLIATSCLATGVDGLQEVCNRIIVNTLPWTHAEFEQLKGRIYRQGQKNDHVDIIVPLTFANINGERWSWCDSRWKRIQFKKSIADAAVDGVIPEGHLRTPSQAYQDIMNWLKRLEEGSLIEIERQKINLFLSEDDIKHGLKRLGDFSKMNRQLNMSLSTTTHKRYKDNPEDWEFYHAMYREARKEWLVVPFKEAIKWCKARPHLIVGDFGCGEALISKEVENKIYSFDHVAINEDVIACDISHTPLDDESLDAAIFSLSLMGSNYMDYIKEAHRCLKLDGHLWIAEATSRFKNLDSFEEYLEKLGFDIVRINEKANFTFLRAIKSDRRAIES